MAKYIKIPADFFEREPIKTLEELPNRDKTILLYLDLLCETNKKNSKGIYSVGNITLTDDALSSVFRCENIGACLAVLEQYGLIKRSEKTIHVFKFWDEPHDRSSTAYVEWRKTVFFRDGFRCTKCGTTRDLQAHHIKSWKLNRDSRYEVANGVTLCRKCHLEAHDGSWKNICGCKTKEGERGGN